MATPPNGMDPGRNGMAAPPNGMHPARNGSAVPANGIDPGRDGSAALREGIPTGALGIAAGTGYLATESQRHRGSCARAIVGGTSFTSPILHRAGHKIRDSQSSSLQVRKARREAQ
jgi:hypothetical protein